ncbi:unnamed protein product, partial [Rotaria sordida]
TLLHDSSIIGDLDIASAGLKDARRRISIIPQDYILCTSKFRINIDQFGLYSDAEISNALGHTCHYFIIFL